MRREAEVASGLKGPEHNQGAAVDRNDPLYAEKNAARSVRAQDDETEVVFQGSPGYIYTVSSPRDRIDQSTGEKIVTRPILAKFDQGGFYRLQKNDENYDLIYRRLTTDKYFGLGRHFWLLSELKAKNDQAEEAAVVAQLEANPTLLARVAAQLGGRMTQSFEQPRIVPQEATVPPAEPKPLNPADPTLKEAKVEGGPAKSEAKPAAQAPSPAASK